MSDLSSKFSREDIETLIEAMGDWEMLGNQEFHVLQMIKSAPMPPEDHEAFDVMQQIKNHFRNREKDIMRSREVRQERAVFLKAKLMLVRKDLGISQLFEMAAEVDTSAPSKPKDEVREGEGWVDASTPKAPRQGVMDYEEALKKAEFFIKDLGVWDHYQKFLSEKSEE